MRKKRLLFSVTGVIVGLLLGFAIGSRVSTENAAADQSGRYPLLAKRIFIDNPNDPIINFEALRESLNGYFQEKGLSGSLYFEYLPTGTSIRVNGDTQEVAASLMKLPAAMDAYKAAEQGKIDLNKTLTLQAAWLDSGYGELYKKGVGYQLTLNEAIKIMLEESDNTALKAVTLTTIGLVKPQESVLNAVDVDVRQNPDLTVSIGARSYGSFLKCLYFACYDNQHDSQQILEYLAHSRFDQRLVAGVGDSSVTIAHKIGVHSDVQSDCGIVYLPRRNYLLCVILKGADSQTSDQHIVALSKLTHDYIKSKSN